jgi:glyoxylase-like metal-dependent hydrolase (beta-lactamase superfamily II)
MAPAPVALPLDKSFTAETGAAVEAAPGIVRVTAPNAGPYTFTGTNSFLIGGSRVMVLDPGPDEPAHLAALLRAIGGRKVEAVLLTHTHRDHSALAPRLARAVGAPIRFSHPHRLYRHANWLEKLELRRSCDFALAPDIPIADGEEISIDGVMLEAIATPGHCENHLAFGVLGSAHLLAGDHVMGWSSTVIAPPDGAMGPYLTSLEKVIGAPYVHYLPAHGGPIADGRGFARALLAHRQYRNGQIVEGVAAGDDNKGRLLRRLYPGLSARLLPAARKTIEAHLDYLAERGEVRALGGGRYGVGEAAVDS